MQRPQEPIVFLNHQNGYHLSKQRPMRAMRQVLENTRHSAAHGTIQSTKWWNLGYGLVQKRVQAQQYWRTEQKNQKKGTNIKSYTINDCQMIINRIGRSGRSSII
jgi:hypothetical protein